MRRRPLIAASAILLGAFGLCAAGCSVIGEAGPTPAGTAPTPSAISEPPRATTPLPRETVPSQITVAVLGDSNTTGFSGTLENGIAAGTAWVAQLPSDQFSVVGGWAIDGSPASAMADAAGGLPEAEFLVVMAGTNDIALGVPTEVTLQEITRIADAARAATLVLCAIPPLNGAPDAAQELNASIEAHASAHGWLFIDPWVQMRNPDGTWVAEYLTDGVHTSADGYAAAGRRIAGQMRELLLRPNGGDESLP